MNKEPTQRQSDVLDLLRKGRIKERMPSVREIGKSLGIRSPNGVMCHLKALEKKGFVVMSGGKSRGIRLTEPSPLERATTLLRLASNCLQPQYIELWDDIAAFLRETP